MQKKPTPLYYWVLPGQLMAGEYPGAKAPAQARQKVERFLEQGVGCFIDLTEAGEGLEPYAHLLEGRAAHQRLPIRDNDVPPKAQMGAILDAIDAALADGRQVYVHCFGGHGRTGTVVGCWLVRHGAAPVHALEQIKTLRAALPAEVIDQPSPQTAAQFAFVRAWSSGE